MLHHSPRRKVRLSPRAYVRWVGYGWELIIRPTLPPTFFHSLQAAVDAYCAHGDRNVA